jgi:hypothetical protein
MQYPSYFTQNINDINGLLSPSYGNYEFNGPQSLYVGSNEGLLGYGGDSTSSSASPSIGSPTGSAIGDIGYAISNMTAISPMASAIASAMMDAISSTSVNSVNATNGMDIASDIATAMGLSTAAGVDGPAGASSNGMGSDVGGEGGVSSSSSDSGSTGGDSVGGDGTGSAGGDSASSSSSSGDGGSGGGGDGSSGDYMGGLIGMPEYIHGMVTRQNTFGKNPAGPDDAYRKTQLGEYVIKKSAVQKYGRGLLDMINNEEIPKRKLKGIL